MPLTTMDQLLAALPGQHLIFYKPSVTSEGAGLFQSLWKTAGLPLAGANPALYTAGSGYLVNNATLGSLNYVNAGAGNANYLARALTTMSINGMLILYDRLWTCSGLITTGGTPPVTLTVTTPETVSRGGTNGCELFLEVYTPPGTTTATWSVSYTDAVNGAGRTATYTHPGNAETVGQMLPMQLQAGDTSPISVASFTYSASSGTAGDIGVTILRRVTEIPILVGGGGIVLDAFGVGLPTIPNDACLALMVLPSGTSTGIVTGAFDVVQG